MFENLEISQKSIIFAENFKATRMAGRFIILDVGVKARMGEWGKNDYTRRLPGHPENIVSICKKPRYTKKQKRKMAERPTVQRFCEVNAEAHAIFQDPVRKAEWQARHVAARQDASRHNYYVPVRLWDYVRHELNIRKKEAAKESQEESM